MPHYTAVRNFLTVSLQNIRYILKGSILYVKLIIIGLSAIYIIHEGLNYYCSLVYNTMKSTIAKNWMFIHFLWEMLFRNNLKIHESLGKKMFFLINLLQLKQFSQK